MDLGTKGRAAFEGDQKGEGFVGIHGYRGSDRSGLALDAEDKVVSGAGIFAEPVPGHHGTDVAAAGFDDEVGGCDRFVIGPDGAEEDILRLVVAGLCDRCHEEQRGEDKSQNLQTHGSGSAVCVPEW